MVNTNCLHEGCQRKLMTHGNGYCHLHGDRRKCTYPQCSNYAQSDGVRVQHGYKKIMHKQQMHQKCHEEWDLHQSWCKVLLHYAWVWKAIVSGREVQILLQMVVNNIFNWLVGGGHYSSSKCDSWYAPWGNFYNLSSCRWWTKISFHQLSCHNHGHYQMNSRSYSTIYGDE